MSKAPIAPPAMAPMKRAGAKMPPAPPLEYENTVAASFIRHNGMRTVTASLPASAALTVS